MNSGSSCVTILNPPSVTLYCLYGTDYKGVLILQLSGSKPSRKLPLSSVSFVIFMIALSFLCNYLISVHLSHQIVYSMKFVTISVFAHSLCCFKYKCIFDFSFFSKSAIYIKYSQLRGDKIKDISHI